MPDQPFDLVGVPALTLRNPWAHLIAHHGKNVENRGWVPGPITRLMIHAGKGWDWISEAQYRPLYGPDAIPTSAIVAVTIVERTCSATVNAPRACCGCGDWAVHGQYHWRLRSTIALPEPVAARGGRGLWYPDGAIRAAVEHQMAAAGGPAAAPAGEPAPGDVVKPARPSGPPAAPTAG